MRLLAGFGILNIAFSCVLGQAPKEADPAEHGLKEVSRLMERFKASPNSEDAKAACAILKRLAFHEPATSSVAQSDHALAHVWLKAIYDVDTAVTELREQLLIPVSSVVPEDGDGNSLSPGPILPSEVKDPVVRKRYEDAIAENNRRAQFSNNWAAIRMMDDQMNFMLMVWARNHYRNDSAGTEAFLEDALSAHVDAKRIEKLRAFIANDAKSP